MNSIERQIRIARNDIENEIEYLDSLGRKSTEEEINFLEELQKKLSMLLKKERKKKEKNNEVSNQKDIVKRINQRINELNRRGEFLLKEGQYSMTTELFKEIDELEEERDIILGLKKRNYLNSKIELKSQKEKLIKDFDLEIDRLSEKYYCSTEKIKKDKEGLNILRKAYETLKKQQNQ